MGGQAFEVPVNPQRIVADYYVGELLYLGAPLVGADLTWPSNSWTHLVAELTDVGQSMELVSSLEPDLIITMNEAYLEQYETIAPTVFIPWDAYDPEELMIVLGEVVNNQDVARQWLKGFEARLEELAAVMPDPSLFTITIVDVFGTDLYLYGPDVAEKAFIRDANSWLMLTPEMMPDYIGDYLLFLNDSGQADSNLDVTDPYKNNVIWDSLPAVVNGRVFYFRSADFMHEDPFSLDLQINTLLEIFSDVVGFGTWQASNGDVAENAVIDALKAGYFHIDTAAVYKNEESVGCGIKKSGLNRKNIFVTTKAWNDVHTYKDAKVALANSLDKLGLDYVDLYLIHWPNPLAVRNRWEERNRDVWRYFEEALEAGLVRSIGVSNFHERHLDSLLKTAKVVPHVNQIHLSPSDMQLEVVAANEKHGILTQGYSPLGTGTILEIPALVEIAQKHQKTPAQVAIRWSLQKGYNPLPKSVTTSRIISNINVFDFELTDAQIKVIEGLAGTGNVASNPDERDF
ncbi:hypothetical protein NQ315_004441 [Exocentrus adspersus]|uniref:Aldo/keto reductase n=1 Tax=Exocentrus adspersus TaxID=1586481 RepID=A0AAV8VAI5_9CUCU|nr:hypothetical protein NQ315_004441 [Exocentrus adspersus]